MPRDKNDNQKQKKKRKKKKRINKVFVSTAAFFTAAVVVVFCIYHLLIKTDFFNVKSVDIVGNKYYDDAYILDKAKIKLGEKIYKIDRKRIKEEVEKEVYVKSVRVVYELPNRIYLGVTERQEEYQVFYNNEYIVTDREGVVLNIYNTKNDLLTIESSAAVVYNVGGVIEFEGIDDIQPIYDSLEYINSQFDDETITKMTVSGGNTIVLFTKYDTQIKIRLDDDIKYQITFAMKIINDRLNNNLTVASGMIDFTRGDSPVYIEGYQVEENNEQAIE